ncbi:hypothetical protein LTR36_007250 [Oleoguttula mirabilis]|uniref:Cryptic loci regulator 2 N-terminal domain-containing protein n=1 Tax=Oleoguttula mirabilis TaxID=1507867 RepID=A0AAV9JAR9_9PEZI|nr:hypothetical protein LTR36_007250 [Oleoguttula mirabilis]
MPVQILNIQPGSDGDGRRRPKTDDMKRNDDYYLEHIATDRWAKDLGMPTGTTYRLDRLPNGYAGYEKSRFGDSKHVDRYMYGHPRGVFRSMAEFYPHFKHLMDNQHAFGCPCKMCVGYGTKKVRKSGSSTSASRVSGTPAQPSPYFAPPQPPTSKTQLRAAAPAQSQAPPQDAPRGRPRQSLEGLAQGRPDPSPLKPPRRNQVDEEGTPDIYRALIDRLRAAGPESKVEQHIVENMSPDWRTGHAMLQDLLKEWQELPSYVPRQGELVMFVRHLGPSEIICWDATAQTDRIVDLTTMSWVGMPKWEAGVVAQMPTESITDGDLLDIPEGKQHNVVNSGFRIEPLSAPTYTKQHKYISLHGTRPLALWKECLYGHNEKDWHPTIRHALAVTSSCCVIGKYRFTGTWPDATIFAQGLYIGPELVMLGDAVRLHPRAGDEQTVTDVMVITAIKMRLVNLDEASDDDYDEGHPYNTCIHISGRTYTQDARKSFDGVGKVPIPQDSPLLPRSMQGLGTWYHVCDPKKTKARIEVPYQRVIGRCYESAALKAWFSAPEGMPPPTSGFQAVNAKPIIKINDRAESAAAVDISRGLAGILEARKYSQEHDIRIDHAAGRTWYWADTRIEQLDLHEVNSRFVGIKDDKRTRQQVEDWRKAFKALDGKKGGLEEYHAARVEREQAQAVREGAMGASSSGMIAAAAAAIGASGTGTEAEAEEEEEVEGSGVAHDDNDAMEVDEARSTMPRNLPTGGDAMDVDVDDDDEDDDEVDARNALAAFKAAPAATCASRRTEVIDLDDD